MIDFSRNHFELFGLPARFGVDAAALEQRYRELQRDVHPDRHASGSAVDKRLALQASAHVNEAHRTLSDPVARAEYLLALRGIRTNPETDNRLPLAFLAQQLERREDAERAAHAHDERALAELVREVRDDADRLRDAVGQCLDNDDVDGAGVHVRQMRFLAKLAEDLDGMHALELDR
jgi:molecular chaperone HscB